MADGGDLTDYANLAAIGEALVVLIGTIIALREVRSVGRSQRFAGTQEYYKLLGESSTAREYVYNKLPSDTESLKLLSQIASNRDPHFASNRDPSGVYGLGLSG